MNQDKKVDKILYFIVIVPVIWFSLLVAPYMDKGIINVIKNGNMIFNNPLNITWSENSLKTILIFLALYFILIVLYESTRKNYRRKEEHGSAKWGDAKELNRKYKQLPENMNKTLTKNVEIGLNGRKHKRNLNVLVVGGSGAGKTFSYCKPNVMQANSSFVVLDPKGEILRDTGYLLKLKGYEVKVLDLINMEKSHCYNPFVYLRNDNDVQRLVTNLFKSTTPKGSTTQDPFWDTAASMLLLALIFYLYYKAPPEEQNFSMVMEMLRAGEVNDEDDDGQESALDVLFNRLETENPNHIALKYYRSYHSGSSKTLKSIQVTLQSRLEKFNLESLANLTITDEMDLWQLGEKKTALFAIIPDNDTSFNFLVSILYTQLFQQLFYTADYKYGGSLPIHVHFVMDEFANVSLPDDFDKILSVMRSRNVSVSIILQNLAQLKALFEKQWEGIVGNCDTFLYLGGNEQSTHKYVSELLGKETIDTDTYGRTFGQHGSYSTNYQITGRELMTPDEVRMLDNKYALLFIRGERPVKDFKYNMLEHPNVKYTANGLAKPYEHGTTERAIASISFNISDIENATKEIKVQGIKETDYELVGRILIMKVIKNNENEFYKADIQIVPEKKEKKKMNKHLKRGLIIGGYALALNIVKIIPVFAADDPLAVVNNLSNFIFGLIRAVGMIILGFGVVQLGMSLKSHDPTQRANGIMTLAGGIVITFAREILNLITGG